MMRVKVNIEVVGENHAELIKNTAKALAQFGGYTFGSGEYISVVHTDPNDKFTLKVKFDESKPDSTNGFKRKAELRTQ